jgi:hypothetical protein
MTAPSEVKLCNVCGIRPRRQGGRNKATNCNHCMHERYREQRFAARRRRRRELRIRLLLAYGGRCVQCGETDLEVLVLDHVNDDGAAHRSEVGNQQVYRDLERRGYPPVVQVLCANDNLRKERRRYELASVGSSG